MKILEYKPTNYPSDLTDKQWAEIENFFSVGNKSGYHKRSLVEAVLYLVDNGCKWRAIPHDYPPHGTIWSFYWRAKKSGLWDKIMKHLVKKTRIKAGRTENPSCGLIDSQSVKTIYASHSRGIDGEKNKRAQAAYCNRYYGEYSRNCCPRRQHSRHKKRTRGFLKSFVAISLSYRHLCR